MSPPKIVAHTVTEINNLIGYLIETGLVNDQNFPAVSSSIGNIWDVSFSQSEYLSIAYNDISYEEVYEEFYERRCFSLKFLDGGILQISFRFQDNEVLKHRLAYYPSTKLACFSEVPESYEKDELYTEITTRKIVPFPIRFDYDPAQAQDIKHPKSHLTLGDVKYCRIPISAPLTPRWFIEFIVRCFYHLESRDLVSNLPKSILTMPRTITPNEEKLIHLLIPY